MFSILIEEFLELFIEIFYDINLIRGFDNILYDLECIKWIFQIHFNFICSIFANDLVKFRHLFAS